ncbi:hypothetical protein IWX90DRAFT_300371 [Phyllosticta citrichinensis]|uniref:Uncharacterized protein n=1 Tax=Phyllosticta citrichinensis TaxID=1130410 RepID=A0ABR1XKT4_9PEZI
MRAVHHLQPPPSTDYTKPFSQSSFAYIRLRQRTTAQTSQQHSVDTSIILPIMTSPFERDASKMRGLLEDAKKFKRSESRRLSRIIQSLRSENTVLQGNLSSQATITAEVSNVLHEVPVRRLPTPSPAYFDELMPLLADFVETHDDDYRGNPVYDSIWEDFARMQAAENGLDRCAKLTKDLAIENHGLRMRNIEFAAGELKETLKAINGEAPHPAVFGKSCRSAFLPKLTNSALTVRRVPFTVSSNQHEWEGSDWEAIREFEKISGGEDLVLRDGLQTVPGSEGQVYHPYSAYYIPSFPGQGIPHSGGQLEVADPVAFFELDEYFCIATPADAVLWVKKTGNNGSWVF